MTALKLSPNKSCTIQFQPRSTLSIIGYDGHHDLPELQRNCHHSAFAGYHRKLIAYSTVRCLSCKSIGRTKAKYVQHLKNAEWCELNCTVSSVEANL